MDADAADNGNGQRLADYLAIADLVARLAHMADMGHDLDQYLDCLTEDAVWEFPGNPSLGLAPTRSEGRRQIAADRATRRIDRFQGPGTGSRHLNTTLTVQVRGSDAAEAESCWLFVAAGPDGPVVRAMGAYQDRFRRTDGRWKLANRRIIAG